MRLIGIHRWDKAAERDGVTRGILRAGIPILLIVWGTPTKTSWIVSFNLPYVSSKALSIMWPPLWTLPSKE